MVQVTDNASKPASDTAQPRRLCFRKCGALQYISHLDLQRTFLRAVVRAKIPVWYTEGFNPKPRLSFATPLSVGCESVYELMDFKTVEDMDNESIRDALNRQLPPELAVSEVYIPARKIQEIAWSVYTITVTAEGALPDAESRILEFLGQKSLVILKKTKSGEKDTDIAPMICRERTDVTRVGVGADEQIKIHVTLAAGCTAFLNPEAVVKTLADAGIILSGKLPTQLYSLMREDLLDADMKHFQ